MLLSALLFFIGLYRTIGTTYLGGCCRFTPSCSEYAVDVIRNKHSFLSASFLITRRILKCRPFGDIGFDPAPQKQGLCCGK